MHDYFSAESEPLSLQDACRSSIRTILRHNVEVEHPDLKARRRRHPKKKSMKKKSSRQLVIPIFEESDNDEFGTGAADDDEGGERDIGRASVIYDIQRQRAGHITAVIELARSLAGHRRSVRVQQQQRQEQQQNENNNTDAQRREGERMEATVDVLPAREVENGTAECSEAEPAPADKVVTSEKMQAEASVSTTAIAEQRKKIPKREKFDSGIGDEIENGKGLSSDSDRDEEGGTFMEVDSDSDFSDPLPSAGKRSHRSQNGGEKTSQAEVSPSHPTETARKPFVERRARGRNMGREAVIWKRLAFAADEESDEKSEEEAQDGPASNTMEVHDTSTPVMHTDSYTIYMRSKIQALPLPQSLKAYINLYREF